MTLLKKKSEAEMKNRHFTWTLTFCYLFMIGAARQLFTNLICMIYILSHPTAQTIILDTGSHLRFNLPIIEGYAQLSKEHLPLADTAVDVALINGTVFAAVFLFLCLIAHDLPIFFIGWKSYRILRTMKHSWSPFVPEIAEHISWIGRISLFMGLFWKLILQVVMSYIVCHKFHFNNPTEIPYIAAGLILLLIGDIFKTGCWLQQEVDETL